MTVVLGDEHRTDRWVDPSSGHQLSLKSEWGVQDWGETL